MIHRASTKAPTSSQSARDSSRPPVRSVSSSATKKGAQSSCRTIAAVCASGGSNWLRMAETKKPDAGRGHELSAAAVRAPAPGDEPARRERSADQPVDHLHGLDVLLAGPDHRHERGELRADRHRPEHEPEGETALGRRRSCARPGHLARRGIPGRACSPRHPTGANRIIPSSCVVPDRGLHDGLAAACGSSLTRAWVARGRQNGQRHGDAGHRGEARLAGAVALASRPDRGGPDEEAEVGDRRHDRHRARRAAPRRRRGRRSRRGRARRSRCRRRRRRCPTSASAGASARGRRAACRRRPGRRRRAAASARSRARRGAWPPRRESAAAPANRAGRERAEGG